MKYKNIIFFFAIALPVSVVVRLLQIIYTIDALTGFFKQPYRSMSTTMTIVMLLACAVTAILSFTTHRSPEKPPKVNIFLGLTSVALGASILIEIVTEHLASSIPLWQILLLDISGLLATAFFLAYGAGAVLKFKLPGLLSVFPCIYWIARLICVFMSVSPLALISDNVLILACYCVSLLFMVNFAKLMAGIKDDYNFRKLMSFGFVAVILCAADGIPRAVLMMTGRAAYLHSSVSATYTVLAAGLFILAFTLSHFGRGNLSFKRRLETTSTEFMPDDGSYSDFYVEPGKPREKPYY